MQDHSYTRALDLVHALTYESRMDIPGHSQRYPQREAVDPRRARGRPRCHAAGRNEVAAGTSFPRGPNYEKLKALAEEVVGWRGEWPFDGARPVRVSLVTYACFRQSERRTFPGSRRLREPGCGRGPGRARPALPTCARIVVFDVDGNSMNSFDPPIPDGSRVSGPVFEDIREVPQNGMAVTIQRRSADGQMLEWSVKEVEVRDDGFTFHPRSTDNRYKPIVVDTDLHADDGKTVEIIAPRHRRVAAGKVVNGRVVRRFGVIG